jgi:hypothetical protein
MEKPKPTLMCPRCGRNHAGSPRTKGALSTVCLICVGQPMEKPAKRTRQTPPATSPANKKD